MQIKNTTRMAFQAAIAIAISELISSYFNLEHGYWSTLTAMALIAQTWGESVKRSIERVLMTILGGLCGTFLYFFVIPSNEIFVMGILLIFIFLTVYLIPINNLIAVFTLTGFVVFFFALLGDWNFVLLKQRIEETALGALIAVVVGFFFLPVKTNIKETLISYLEKMSLSLGAIFTESYKRQLFLKEQLYAEFHTVRKKALSIRYEVLFHRLNTLDFNSLWTQILFCTQYLANLIESYQWLSSYLNEEEKEDIEVAIKTTQYNIQTIIEVLQGSKSTNMIPAHNLLDILKHAITTEPTRFAALENEALGFYNLMYFFARLNTRLHETYILLQQTI
ncbi:FUSC family protein [Legionella brunensis]|uniref:Fusaric acid resistance protein family protein n=1 Tax=Legionella brunensis TaxID=29422 RepID=A0A0W0SPC7_9GAMM|nr:FUSC family protein [Legionella brunensis]KTC85231.1 Fusaric acid resistance protein family protein [Legionella brunensis]